MSSAVLIVLTIPNKDHEIDIKNQEELCNSLKRPQNGIKKSMIFSLHLIRL
jgi:hypothetical protein